MNFLSAANGRAWRRLIAFGMGVNADEDGGGLGVEEMVEVEGG